MDPIYIAFNELRKLDPLVDKYGNFSLPIEEIVDPRGPCIDVCYGNLEGLIYNGLCLIRNGDNVELPSKKTKHRAADNTHYDCSYPLIDETVTFPDRLTNYLCDQDVAWKINEAFYNPWLYALNEAFKSWTSIDPERNPFYTDYPESPLNPKYFDIYAPFWCNVRVDYTYNSDEVVPFIFFVRFPISFYGKKGSIKPVFTFCSPFAYENGAIGDIADFLRIQSFYLLLAQTKNGEAELRANFGKVKDTTEVMFPAFVSNDFKNAGSVKLHAEYSKTSYFMERGRLKETNKKNTVDRLEKLLRASIKIHKHTKDTNI